MSKLTQKALDDFDKLPEVVAIDKQIGELDKQKQELLNARGELLDKAIEHLGIMGKRVKAGGREYIVSGRRMRMFGVTLMGKWIKKDGTVGERESELFDWELVE